MPQRKRSIGREACLIDLDVQFGDAAFQLGLRPNLTLVDLLEAGSRARRRSAARDHDRSIPAGFKVIAAPPNMMPLGIADPATRCSRSSKSPTREFGTVFVDLPTNWTNWSLSLLARSDLVLLVTELNVPSLNRAKRQLELMRAQELDDLDVRDGRQPVRKGLLRTIRPADVREALGRDMAYTVANDHRGDARRHRPRGADR